MLSVACHAGPLERVRADLAVVGLFRADGSLRHGAGRADWRLCGALSQLISTGRVKGTAGEAVLVPSFGGLRAPLILALGLGEGSAFSAEACRGFAREAVRRGLALESRRVALAIPVDASALSKRIEALLGGAAEAVAEHESDLELQLVPDAAESSGAGRALDQARPEAIPASVSLRVLAAERASAPRQLYGAAPRGGG